MTERSYENLSEFKVVSNKKNRKNKSKNNYDPLEYNLRRIETIKEELSSSNYYLKLINSLETVLTSSSELREQNQGINEILCYGIGNISDSLSSKYQFVLLLLLQQTHSCSSIQIYDPVLNTLDKTLIQHFKCKLITSNEECKRIINTKTLIYMPRCPIQLINNLLYFNWNFINLNNIILLSNSFQLILESNTNEFLNKNLKFIWKLSNYVEEIQLIEDLKDYKDYFNDISLHVFNKEKIIIEENNENFWKLNLIEPKYDECNFETTN